MLPSLSQESEGTMPPCSAEPNVRVSPYWAQAPSTQYHVTMSPSHVFSRLHARKFQVTNPLSVGEINHYLIGVRLPFFLRSARFFQYSFELGSKGLRCIRTFGYFHHWQTSV